jgi:hypothetical protein
MMRGIAIVGLAALTTSTVSAQDAVRMVERFDADQRTRVEMKVELSGQITLPATAKDKPGDIVPVTGFSLIRYDERPLPRDSADGDKTLRLYRTVDFRRTIGRQNQSQEIRPEVRRMVVIRSPQGKKAPFSPDGPLTFGEIDAVRVDLFAPVLIPGLLPAKAVAPGERWSVTEPAAQDLTGLEKIDDGKLTVEFVAPVVVDGRRQYRLSLTGTIRGVSEDGPVRHTIDGTVYFDPNAAMLTYLSLKGTQHLLDASGATVGSITGRFTMTRSASESAELADAAVRRVETKPTAENTLLLYRNADLGVEFQHPRHWRVGAVQGRQITIECPSAKAGILLTVEPRQSTPTAAAFQKEATEFIGKQKGRVLKADPPRTAGAVDRFGLDAEIDGHSVRMEYAVSLTRDGGWTLAARLPAATAADHQADLNRILQNCKLTKTIDR